MRDIKLIDTKNRACAVASFRDDGFDASIKHGKMFLDVRQYNADHCVSMSYVPTYRDGVAVRTPRPETVSEVATILESAFFFMTGKFIEFDFEVCVEDVR
jgi:hypothetical protein